jgi:putative ABC transport system permease protein
MFDLDRFQEIWVTITRNKVRSFLTGFGVFWGIFMLMIMLGAGTGLQRGMMEQLEGFATNSCFFWSGVTNELYKGFQKGRQWNIRNRDIEILQQMVPELDCLSPMLFGGNSANNIVYNENYGTFQIKGVFASFNEVERQTIDNGRFINELDNLEERKICVIGTKVYEELFPTKENPIGCYVRIWGIYFQVVGVVSGVSNISIGGRSAESVYLPFKTLQKVINQGDIVHFLAATAKPNIPISKMEEKVKEILRQNNFIAPTDEQAVGSFNLENQFNIFKYLFLGIAIVVWIVGSGTLIAGIVGVSNIMVVTVKERTKEIGIRRALGAKPRTIIGQIMWESLVLTAIAGILGLCFGVLCLYLADTLWLQNAENMFISNPIVSFSTAVSSTIILLFFGLIAGLIPAARAMQIKAIDAIQEE